MTLERGWLITHADCLDGATAALIGMASGLTPVFVEPDRVAQGLASLPDDKPVYLADVSLREPEWPTWNARISWLLDHHQSALHLANEPRVTVDLSRCAAHLLYDYAVGSGWLTATPNWHRLVLSVERYDLWKPNHALGQNLNRLFHDKGFSWYQNRFGAGWVPYTEEEAEQLARLITKEREFVARHVAQSQIHMVPSVGLSIAGVILQEEGPVNEISHALLAAGHALTVILKPDGRLSGRSDPRIDTARLMEQLFHGGGHPRAAGGRLDDTVSLGPETLNRVLDQIAHYLTESQRQ